MSLSTFNIITFLVQVLQPNIVYTTSKILRSYIIIRIIFWNSYPTNVKHQLIPAEIIIFNPFYFLVVFCSSSLATLISSPAVFAYSIYIFILQFAITPFFRYYIILQHPFPFIVFFCSIEYYCYSFPMLFSLHNYQLPALNGWQSHRIHINILSTNSPLFHTYSILFILSPTI